MRRSGREDLRFNDTALKQREEHKRDQRRQVEHRVEGVRGDAVAPRQRAVGAAEQCLVTGDGGRGSGAEQVRDPPRTELAQKQKSVRDPEPAVGASPDTGPRQDRTQKNRAGSQTERRSQRSSPSACRGCRSRAGGQVVQTAHRNDVVNQQKHDLKRLQCEKSSLDAGVHGGDRSEIVWSVPLHTLGWRAGSIAWAASSRDPVPFWESAQKRRNRRSAMGCGRRKMGLSDGCRSHARIDPDRCRR